MNKPLLIAGGVFGAGLAWWSLSRVDLKPGVVLKGLDSAVMQPVLAAANRAARSVGLKRATVTSGLDGEHSDGSLHYRGRALDVRRVDWPNFDNPAAARHQRDLIARQLGPGYDVLLEGTHIHAEYDPKPGDVLGVA